MKMQEVHYIPENGNDLWIFLVEHTRNGGVVKVGSTSVTRATDDGFVLMTDLGGVHCTSTQMMSRCRTIFQERETIKVTVREPVPGQEEK